MKKLVLSLALCLIHSLALAQVTPALQSGSKALLFNFSGLDNLNANSFNGGIGVKYYLSPSTAFRGGLQFASANEDDPANPASGQQAQDGETSATRVGISGALEFHGGTGRVTPMWGLGVAFSTTSTERKNPNIGPASGQFIVKNSRNGELINGLNFVGGSQVDFFALVGAEFFIVKEASLSAEYRFGFSKISRKDQETTQGPNTATTKLGGGSGFGIATAGVLTLAIYF